MQLNISIHSDIIEKYLIKRKEFKKTPLDYNLVSIIENPFNKIVISKKYLGFLDEVFTPDSELYNDYSTFMTYLIDGKSEIVESNNSKSIDDELEHISNSCNTATISIFENSHKQNRKIRTYLCLDKVGDCPKSKVFLGLLKDRKAIVRYNDFDSNATLKVFFNEIFNLPRNVSSTTIIERYANTNHSYFDFFEKNKILVKYYKHRATISDGNTLKGKFKRIELYNTTNGELIHERLIVLGNLIINLDEDPMNLDVSRKTWTITITYSYDEAQNLLKKCNDFAKVGFI